MTLHVFVNEHQIGDRGHLAVEDLLEVDLRALPVANLVFQVPEGTKALHRTGVFEYLLAGEVMQVQSGRVSAPYDGVWQKVLLDCGVPVTVIHSGLEPLRLRGAGSLHPAISDSSLGACVGGVAVLEADISFFSPQPLSLPIKAKVRMIEVVRIQQSRVIELDRAPKMDFRFQEGKGVLGAMIEIELEPH